jgi:hypothetical protein
MIERSGGRCGLRSVTFRWVYPICTAFWGESVGKEAACQVNK